MNYIHYLSMIFFAIAFAACSKDDGKENTTPENFMDIYGGDPYMGTVQVDIEKPDGDVITDDGESSAHFVDEGEGKARFVLFGAIQDEEGDAGFAITGTYNGLAWRGDEGYEQGIPLDVNESGEITGGGTNSVQEEFQFDGTITETRFRLVIEAKALEETEGGFPPGTTFTFRYNLGRDVSGDGDGSSADCDRIIWRQQYVAGFDGSGSMVMVPMCVEE